MTQKKLTTQEVADQLQISVQTIRRYIQSGELRAARIGKNWRIDQKDIDAFYENHIPTKESLNNLAENFQDGDKVKDYEEESQQAEKINRPRKRVRKKTNQ